MARQIIGANAEMAFNLQDFRRTAYSKINDNFAELYSKLSWGYGVPGAGDGQKGTMYLRQDGGAGTTFYVREAAGAPVAGTNVLTLSANPLANETVVIDDVTYIFRVTLSSAYDVLIGATASDSLDNLIAAINASAGAGTLYGTATAVHPSVTAAAGAGDTLTLTAKTAGAVSNLITTAETLTVGNFASSTLMGGTDDDGSGWVAK